MKPLSDLALVRRHEALSRRISKLVDKLCDAGLGHLRFSEIRALASQQGTKLCVQYVALVDEAMSLRYEAEQRYGSDLMTMRQLVWRNK